MSRDCRVRLRFTFGVNYENGCGTVVSFNLDNRRCRFFTHFSHRFELRRDVVAKRALHVPTSRRQHFLKREAVFFDVLVYSGCSAFRFPSARSDPSGLTDTVGDPT